MSLAPTPAQVPVLAAPHSIHTASPLRRLVRPFWVIPAAVTAVAALLGLVLPLVDAALHFEIGVTFPGGPDGARSVLSTIASAMISVTGLVFSITMVVMQLASSQFSPRILQDFLSTRITQWTLGVFVASFVYSLTVLREVRGAADDADAFVPQLSVSLAYLIVLAAFVLFLAFIRTIMRLIQVSDVISRVGDTTLRTLRATLPDADESAELGLWSPAGPAATIRLDDRHGHLVEVDEKRLAALAAEHDLWFEVLPEPGAFLAPGTEVLRVWGEHDEDLHATVQRCLSLGSQRLIRRDPAFGVRQLVDVAERALSPGINDPTTATQVITELRVVLGEAVTRADSPRHTADEVGTVRVAARRTTVRELLLLAVEEIAHYGATTLQVPRALEGMLDELHAIALPRHHGALQEARELARARVAEG